MARLARFDGWADAVGAGYVTAGHLRNLVVGHRITPDGRSIPVFLHELGLRVYHTPYGYQAELGDVVVRSRSVWLNRVRNHMGDLGAGADMFDQRSVHRLIRRAREIARERYGDLVE